MHKSRALLIVGCFTLLLACRVHGEQAWRFNLLTLEAEQGYKSVSLDTHYSESKGYGWLQGHVNSFAVRVPEGNYDVCIHYKSAEEAASAIVRSEARRVMITPIAKAEAASRRFTVNVRTPKISNGQSIQLRRTQDANSPQWDDRLTLEFCSGREDVVSLEIRSNPDALTIYLAGDSTVTDQNEVPWAGWGQMLPQFLQPNVAVANHAESGRALFSFRAERRLTKILESLQPGDYVFIQFGHNDQKDKSPGAGPFSTYKDNLMEYVSAVRSRDGNAVLVTPMERRRWNAGVPGETLSQYAEAVRRVGKETQTPVIDLHAMSLELYRALGEEGSKQAFVHYPANFFPEQTEPLKDNTHHNAFGAYALSRCVVEGIRRKVPALATQLSSDIPQFEPNAPDRIEQHIALKAILNAK